MLQVGATGIEEEEEEHSEGRDENVLSLGAQSTKQSK
jgi:hypothetical protein